MNKWFIASTVSVLVACSGDTASETKEEAPVEVKEDAAPKQMKSLILRSLKQLQKKLHWFHHLRKCKNL